MKKSVVIVFFILLAIVAAIGLIRQPSDEELLPEAPVSEGVDSSQDHTTAASETTADTSPTNPNSSTSMTTNELKIETTKEGTGPAIANGQTAVVQYEGKLADGTVFDSTAKHGGTAFEFPLGAGMVIKGWDEGVLGMKVGETRTLTIPPELGYGPQGYPPIIPPSATLTFTVTLEGIK